MEMKKNQVLFDILNNTEGDKHTAPTLTVYVTGPTPTKLGRAAMFTACKQSNKLPAGTMTFPESWNFPKNHIMQY